jgi:hypothetical protein
VQADPRIDHRARRALAALLEPAQPDQRRADQPVHVVVEPEAVVQLVAVGDQLPQPGGELGGGVRRVGAVVLLGAVEPGAPAVPQLGLGVARPDEHHDALGLGAGPQHQRGLGLEEAGQVDQVGVLAEHVVGIAVAHPLGQRPDHRDGAGPDRLHERIAPGGVDRRIEHPRTIERYRRRRRRPSASATSATGSPPDAVPDEHSAPWW